MMFHSDCVQHIHSVEHRFPAVNPGIGIMDDSSDGLIFVIRKDANYSTSKILECAYSLCRTECTVSPRRFAAILEDAYADWGNDVLRVMAGSLDYCGKYNLNPQTNAYVHFYRSGDLAKSAILKGWRHLKNKLEREPLFISLDGMIDKESFIQSKNKSRFMCGEFAQIGFSRLFSREGEELGFVGRPEWPRIEDQIAAIKEKTEAMGGSSGNRVPIILLEDNVRRAKTLLWLFQKMEEGGVFEHAEIKGISTCFSVATKEERKKLVCQGKKVPLIAGVDYANEAADVQTPRDLFFDGPVVALKDGSIGRLPAFMLKSDWLAQSFKILPEVVQGFRLNILEANEGFCETIERETGFVLPLECFVPGQPIAKTLDVDLNTPMKLVLEEVRRRVLSTAPSPS